MKRTSPSTDAAAPRWAGQLAAAFLAFVALAHAARIVFGVRVVVANVDIPTWASVMAIIGPGALAIALWRECRR